MERIRLDPLTALSEDPAHQRLRDALEYWPPRAWQQPATATSSLPEQSPASTVPLKVDQTSQRQILPTPLELQQLYAQRPPPLRRGMRDTVCERGWTKLIRDGFPVTTLSRRRSSLTLWWAGAEWSSKHLARFLGVPKEALYRWVDSPGSEITAHKRRAKLVEHCVP